MSPAARVAAFVALLAAIFGAAAFAGRTIDPDADHHGAPPVRHEVQR